MPVVGGRNHSILIVDDEEDITKSLKMGMEARGYSVEIYKSPTEAIDNFRPGAFLVAILDVKMPEMSGFELYRRLSKLDAQVRFYFLTAFDILPDESERVLRDIDAKKAIIKKPISLSQLLVHLDLPPVSRALD